MTLLTISILGLIDLWRFMGFCLDLRVGGLVNNLRFLWRFGDKAYLFKIILLTLFAWLLEITIHLFTVVLVAHRWWSSIHIIALDIIKYLYVIAVWHKFTPDCILRARIEARPITKGWKILIFYVWWWFFLLWSIT